MASEATGGRTDSTVGTGIRLTWVPTRQFLTELACVSVHTFATHIPKHILNARTAVFARIGNACVALGRYVAIRSCVASKAAALCGAVYIRAAPTILTRIRDTGIIAYGRLTEFTFKPGRADAIRRLPVRNTGTTILAWIGRTWTVELRLTEFAFKSVGACADKSP